MPISITIFSFFLFITFSFAQTTCKRGTYLAKSGSCKPCPPGFYQSNPATKASSCKPCREGTYFPYQGAQKDSVCRMCPDGSFAKPGSASCTKCPPGTIAKYGSSRCVICKPGEEFGFPTSDGSNPCNPCSPNTYNSVKNGECLPCPPGYVSPAGATSVDQCKKCPDGQAPDFSENKCLTCDKKIQVFDPQTGTCSQPAGGITLPNGKLELCKSGEYERIPGADVGFVQTVCEKCPNGYTTYSPGMRFCRAIGFNCPPNYVELSSGDCFSCDPGMRYLKDSAQCAYCPQGTANRGGGDETCTPCDKLLENGFRADSCPYFDNLLARINGSCPAGTKISVKYPTLCEKCLSNTYSNAKNSVQCTTCDIDEYQPSDMAISCIKCPKGTVRSSDFDDICVVPQTGCKLGEQLVGGEYPNCFDSKKCPGPRPTNIFHNGCYKCQPKEEPDPKQPEECRTCDDLQVSDGRKCKQCPGETVVDGVMSNTCGCSGIIAVNRGIINGECKVCPPGMYGTPGAGENSDNECVKCAAGLVREVTHEAMIYSSAMSRFSVLPKPCVPCPRGYYTYTEGAAKCEKCPNGTTSYGLGETKCVEKVNSPLRRMMHEIESSYEPAESMEESVDMQEVESPQPTGEILFPELDLDILSI